MKHFEFNRLTVLFASFLTLFVFGTAFAQWQPDVRLTYDSLYSYTSLNNAWNVAASGDSVHVVWWDNRTGNYQIYYKRSLDNGTTWGGDTPLTSGTQASEFPSVAASGSKVNLVWQDLKPKDRHYRIYYKRSLNNGTSWSSDTPISADTSGITNPSVSVSGSHVYVVWTDSRDGNNEIYANSSADSGGTWRSDYRLSHDPAISRNASVAASGTFAHAVWEDYRQGSLWRVYYARSTNSGLSWSTDSLLSNAGSYNSEMPCVFASGCTVHVVWSDTRNGNYEIYYKRSTDNGATWGLDTRLTYGTLNYEIYPSIATSGSTVEVVWFQQNSLSQIFATRSTDNGTTWSPVTQLTTEWVPNGQCHSVSVTPSSTHMVFMSLVGSNPEIYYKRRLGSGGYDGFQTEPSQGRHLVRDPARNVLHMVMKSDEKDSVYYLRSTDSGTSWSVPLLLGYGKYPTVGLAALPLGAPIQAYALCVAFRGNQSSGNAAMIRYKWNDNYQDPGNGGTWHDDSLITSLGDCGPLSLITPGTQGPEPRVYVAYPTVPQANPNLIYCDNFYFSTPHDSVREIIDTGSPYSLDQPCLAVDGNGEIYAAWKRGDQIRYARRNGGTWNDTSRVDFTTLASKQPFIECYADSVFVAWADSMASRSDFDVRRAARQLVIPPPPWQYTNISNSPNLASESPTQAWREFTTWSEGTSSAQPDVWYYSPQWAKGDVQANTYTWSYWPHSQMSYTMAGGAYLWSAWTESPTANQPPYTVLTQKLYFAPPPPPGGGDSFSGYYSVQAGQDTPSVYCLKRDGVMRFADKAVDFARDSLVYVLPYLDPQYDYYLRVSSYREAGSNWAQALSIGDSLMRSVQFRSNQVDTVWIKIPPEAYQRDHKVVFALKKVSGDYVTTLGLMLYQRDPLRGKGGPQSAGLADLPLREVFAVSPNPTRGEAQVEYSLQTSGKVDLSVYDVIGRLIRRVVSGVQPAGVYKVAWDGRDQAGRLIGSGVYFLRLSTPERTKTKRLVVVK